MKNTVIIVFAFLLLSASAVANSQFGLGIKAGGTAKKTNLDNAKDDLTGVPGIWSISETESSFLFGGEVFYEHALSDEENPSSFLGVKLGYEGTSSDNIEFRSTGAFFPAGSYKLEVSGSMLPLTVYYKYNISSKFNVYAGGGAGMLFASLKDGPNKYKENKVFGHLDAGVEWRISQLIGLGADFRYSFGNKISNFGDFPQVFSKDIMLDLNGLSAGLLLRFYF